MIIAQMAVTRLVRSHRKRARAPRRWLGTTSPSGPGKNVPVERRRFHRVGRWSTATSPPRPAGIPRFAGQRPAGSPILWPVARCKRVAEGGFGATADRCGGCLELICREGCRAWRPWPADGECTLGRSSGMVELRTRTKVDATSLALSDAERALVGIRGLPASRAAVCVDTSRPVPFVPVLPGRKGKARLECARALVHTSRAGWARISQMRYRRRRAGGRHPCTSVLTRDRKGLREACVVRSGPARD